MDKASYDPPQDIEGLMKIYYGPCMDGKNVSSNGIISYQDFIRTNVVTPQLERYVKKVLSPLGDLTRIQENKSNKVPDYEIKDKGVDVEITSINTSLKRNVHSSSLPLNLPKNEKEALSKINRCIKHINSKRRGKDSDNQLWGVIFYDCIIATLKRFYSFISNKDIVSKTLFRNSDIDTLLFVCRPSSIDGVSSEELYPPMIYVKNKTLANQLSRITGAKIVEVGA
ncbi:MAG: hypothetical protein V1921_02625 [Candidatus Altiarchaeota archaeon]